MYAANNDQMMTIAWSDAHIYKQYVTKLHAWLKPHSGTGLEKQYESFTDRLWKEKTQANY